MIYLVLLILPIVVFASSWVRQKGELFISPTFNYYSASEYYDSNGNKKPIGCTFEKEELQIYGEYGLNDKTTLTFNIPYDYLKCGNSSTSGLSDIDLGFIRQIKRNNLYSFSYYGQMIVPTGYSITRNPRLGYDRFGLEGGLLFGVSGKPGFVDSGLGYRDYFGYPSSQVRSYVTGGLNVYKNLQILTTLDAEIGLGNGRSKNIGNNVTLEPDYKLIQLYIGPRLMFGNVSFVATYQYVIYGRNTGVGRGVNVGLWLDF